MNNIKEVVQEWLLKAEGDFEVAQQLLKGNNPKTYDAICFHAQQCIEKILKALLVKREMPVPKIHNLLELYHLLKAQHFEPVLDVDFLDFLTFSAVGFRYPGESATIVEAQRAFEIAMQLRVLLLQELSTL